MTSLLLKSTNDMCLRRHVVPMSLAYVISVPTFSDNIKDVFHLKKIHN